MVLADLRRLCAPQGIQNHIYSIALSAGRHTANEANGILGHIHLLKLGQAVLAVATITGRTVFSEIPEDILPQAFIGITVIGHLPQPVTVPLFYNRAVYESSSWFS